MSIDQVCEILGISRSTAYSAIKRTGFVIEGVPILRIGDRLLMSAYLLREILGIQNPQETKGKR